MASTALLTKRQIEFLVLSANGKSREEIADECCVSFWTVKSTLESARLRLGVKTINHVLLTAIGNDLIVVDRQGKVYAAGTP